MTLQIGSEPVCSEMGTNVSVYRETGTNVPVVSFTALSVKPQRPKSNQDASIGGLQVAL